MPAYRYRAVHASGSIAQGTATASHEVELAQFLAQSQLELIEAREKKQNAVPLGSFKFSFASVPQRALALFCTHAADLLKAGVPFLDVLCDLAATMPSGLLRDVLSDITRSLRHGTGIAKAFARHGRVFSPVFIAILASGEASGDLTRTFEQLAVFVEGRARMNERLRRALRYPLFLMAVALGVVSFMMTLVVPQIIGFLNSIDTQLPPATRMLVAVSDLFGKIGWMVGLGGISAVLLALILRSCFEPVALALDGMALRLPFIGKVMEKLMLARFTQCFAILVQSGLKIPESLQGARDTLGNRALMARLDVALRQIMSGSSLSAAMGVLFPPFALRILRIGEQGGRLPKALGDIATYYDREGADSAERMIGMLEPALTLMIGGVLAWVVLAVLGPIYGSLSHMNKMG